MAYDRKYGKITTERGFIPEDEPVILFRAQDKLSYYVVRIYHTLCTVAGCRPQHLQQIKEASEAIGDWQQDNAERVKLPD